MPALLTSLQSVWLNQPPQASSDYLSVQLGCSAAQGNLCYIVNNHTCSTTSTPPGEVETPLLLSKQGLILSKTEIDLPPTNISAAKKHSRPSATAATKTKEADIRALQQLPGRRVKTTKSTQWKKTRSQVARCPKAPKKTPEEPKTSPQAGWQLLTLKKTLWRLFRWSHFTSETDQVKGRLKKTSSGRKKKKIK